MSFNHHNFDSLTGRYHATPSPSLNRALEAMCKATVHVDLTPAQFDQAAADIVATYKPSTIGSGHRTIPVSAFLSWFEGLDANEYYTMALGRPPEHCNQPAPWS